MERTRPACPFRRPAEKIERQRKQTPSSVNPFPPQFPQAPSSTNPIPPAEILSMRLLLTLSHALLILLSIPIDGKALDPFYTDADWEKFRDAYLAGKPPSYSRASDTQIPIGLNLEITRLPHFQVSDVSLAEALQHLRTLFDDQTQTPFPECLLTADAALPSRRISLHLNEISALECLRFIGESSGHLYAVMDDKLFFGHRPIEPLNPWDRLQYFNLPISEALAFHWFSSAKKTWQQNDPKPSNAGEHLANLGVPFPAGTRAEFIPSMNLLACVQSEFVLPALQTLVAETEARLAIESSLMKARPLPPNMELRSLKPSNLLRQELSTVLARSGKYLEPRHATTAVVLRAHGVQFPKGASAWFDPSSSQLHVINTPEQLAMIELLNSVN
jgi:hypothetical protein